MSTNKRNAFVVATIFYSMLWFCLLFMVIGFFMPTPVRFCKKMELVQQDISIMW